MRRIVLVPLACFLVLTAAAIFAFFQASRGTSTARLLQMDIPTEGWTVCEIGGLEFIPDVGEQRQVFDICHADGYRYQTYCLQPQIPAPALDTMCSFIENDTVWCGDGVQQLKLYALLDTPPAPDTPTPTRTATSTRTPTRTATSTSTSTATITATSTRTPTLTATGTSTATRTRTPVAPPDYPDRPPPGGPGNVEAMGMIGGLAGAATLLFWGLRRRKAGRV